MQKPARQSFANLMAIIALVLAVIASPVLRAQTNQPSTSGAKPKQPINRINPAYVITPKEAAEWHALKAKGGPASTAAIAPAQNPRPTPTPPEATPGVPPGAAA